MILVASPTLAAPTPSLTKNNGPALSSQLGAIPVNPLFVSQRDSEDVPRRHKCPTLLARQVIGHAPPYTHQTSSRKRHEIAFFRRSARHYGSSLQAKFLVETTHVPHIASRQKGAFLVAQRAASRRCSAPGCLSAVPRDAGTGRCPGMASFHKTRRSHGPRLVSHPLGPEPGTPG